MAGAPELAGLLTPEPDAASWAHSGVRERIGSTVGLIPPMMSIETNELTLELWLELEDLLGASRSPGG
jgi:hypothetical protein